MMIKTTDLTKEYEVGSQSVKALNGINLSVEKGEFLSIMGPSGSGKTTFINLLTGISKIFIFVVSLLDNNS